MSVLIDGSSLLRSADGVGRYTKEIYDRLDNVSILTYSDTDDYGYSDIVRIPVPRKIYMGIYKYTKPMAVNRFLKEKPDVMVYPNFVRAPLVSNIPSILVVHDLTYLHTPDYVRDRNLSYLKKFTPKSMRDADMIIAVSETTKKDIIDNYEIKPDKILVAPNGVDEERFSSIPDKEIKRIRKKYDIEKEYFLFVGTIEPRKNILGIINAYEKLGKSTPTLVLAGNEGWKNAEIHEEISKLRAQGFTIITTGFVDDSDLPPLYAGAKLFIYPSHFEGFGIPILEAQAAGTPVITSDRDPMKEVAGGAALLVDPDDADDIADKITQLYEDDDLQMELIAKGKENIKRYTWDKSAEVFKKAIKDLSK